MNKELSLFTYGSLYEGMVHFHKISPYIVEKEEAQVQGVVYRLPSGYPVYMGRSIDGSDSLDRVHGHRVTLSAPDVVYALLDEFHGVSVLVPDKSLFFKERVLCQTMGADQKESFIYVMNSAKLPKSSVRIMGGDWRENLTKNPSLTNGLSDRQASYIKKLSLSSGRDIVPIDIGLYRELMKLELIVDKGRRLALSKLGAEVARYLPDV